MIELLGELLAWMGEFRHPKCQHCRERLTAGHVCPLPTAKAAKAKSPRRR